jgi:hypothetical protein
VSRNCEVKLVMKAIRSSGVVSDIENLLAPTKTGRPRELPVDAFLTAAVLTAFQGLTLTQKNIHKELTVGIALSMQNAMHARVKKSPHEKSRPVTIRPVRYIFEAIERRLEYSEAQVGGLEVVERERRHDVFQSIIDKLLASSFPQALPKHFALAWDASGVEAWSKPKYRGTKDVEEEDVVLKDVDDNKGGGKTLNIADETGAKPRRGKKKSKKVNDESREMYSADSDARLGYRTKTHDNKSNIILGYDLLAGVAVLPVGAPSDQMPKVVVSFTLEPASSEVKATLQQLDRLVESGFHVDELLVDRGFSNKTPEHWADELRVRGISQVQDIHQNDHGIRDFEGLRVVDGVPHCPRMPDHLADITRPSHFKVGKPKATATAEQIAVNERSKEDLARFDAEITERRVFAFVRNQGAPATAKDQGKAQWQCPSQAGKLKCTLCPSSEFYPEGTPVVIRPPKAEAAPKGCTNKYLTIPGSATAKLQQVEYWGSEAWRESFCRRSHIEGIFGNLRCPSTQNIKRGFCKVTGLVKTGLMLAFEVVAANIRILRQWAKRVGDVSDPLGEAFPVDHGREELDEHGQMSLVEPTFFDDPPDDLVA